MHSSIVKTRTARAVESIETTSAEISVKLGIEPGKAEYQNHPDIAHVQLFALEYLADFLRRLDAVIPAPAETTTKTDKETK